MTIREEQLIPSYIRVAQTLRRRIQEGKYPEGSLIPTAPNLEREFRVSDITIRKALNLLVQDGLILRRRGYGTQVSKRKEDQTRLDVTGDFHDLLDSFTNKPIPLEVEVLEITLATACPNKVRETFSLKPDEKLWLMKRIRKYKGQPISYFMNYSRPNMFRQITKKEIQRQSFVNLLTERCGVQLTKVEQLVEATVADMDLSQILATYFGAPLFFVENIYYSTQNKPMALTQSYFRGDRFKYRVLLNY